MHFFFTVTIFVLLTSSFVVNAGAKAGAYHEAGRKIYNYRCYYCHGYSGDAKTLAATFMEPPPRNFAALEPGQIPRERMIDVVTRGVDGTAMKSFSYYLDESQIEQVVDFIEQEFVVLKEVNTHYHTAYNGWPGHERYRIAYPFATGELPIDMDPMLMTDTQRKGHTLFMTSCISCHDRAVVSDEGVIWQSRSVSYPRNNFSYTRIPDAVDGYTGASVFARHDVAPIVPDLDDQQKTGEKLYQQNCAFCHAADGSGANWIGAFLEPRPRNLADATFITTVTPEYLRKVIRGGIPQTSMPAWENVLTTGQIDAIVSYVFEVFTPERKPEG